MQDDVVPKMWWKEMEADIEIYIPLCRTGAPVGLVVFKGNQAVEGCPVALYEAMPNGEFCGACGEANSGLFFHCFEGNGVRWKEDWGPFGSFFLHSPEYGVDFSLGLLEKEFTCGKWD